MGSTTARWALSALALTLCVPLAFAGGGSKSVSTCTAFDQADKGEDKVEFTIRNTCTVPIDCAITWRLVCAPDSKSRRAVHAGRAALKIGDTTSQSAEASATACGADSWALDNVVWTCQPNKD